MEEEEVDQVSSFQLPNTFRSAISSEAGSTQRSGGGRGSGDCRVQVALRVRPFVNKELVDCESSCVKTKENKITIGQDKDFQFDKVIEQTESQEFVYECCMKQLLEKSFEGYNATVLAYGQTGSGKTFTMGTSNLSELDPEEVGIIPRVIKEIFQVKRDKEATIDMILKISFFEIYNDNIIDLLDPNTVTAAASQLKKGSGGGKSTAANVFIREEVDGSINIYGITEEKVNSAEQMLAALERGSMCRSTSATLMNQTSSRSHAVFTIFLEQHSLEGVYPTEEGRETVGDEPKDNSEGFKISKLHFVDLAGSERLKKTGAVGATMKEGININMGLLSLGNVISALTEQSNLSKKHIPYRDSKLTRILQDSLGGNSNTLMIACISPAESNFEESLNTLKYASRARRIKNKPVVNRDPQSALVNSLKQQLQEAGLETARLYALLKANGIHVEKSVKFKTGSSSASKLSQSDEDQSDVIKQLRNGQVRFEKLLKEVQTENSALKSVAYANEIEELSGIRERDDLRLKLEKLLAIMKERSSRSIERGGEMEVEVQQIYSIDSIEPDASARSLVEEYSENLLKMKKQMKQNEAEMKELQSECEDGVKASMRDQQMLVEKERKITMLQRQLKEKMRTKFRENQDLNIQEPQDSQSESSQSPSEDEMNDEDFDRIAHDPEIKQMETQLQQQQSQKKYTLSQVDGSISAKSEKMRQLNSQQLILQQQLLQKMKEQYHEKIRNLQNDMKRIELQRDSALTKQQGAAEKQKVIDQFKTKVSDLFGQMNEYKKKAKEQEQLSRTVATQEKHITLLGTEISKFKQIKVSLFKEMKKHQEEFEKFRQKKCKDFIIEKRKGIEKEKVIFRLQNQAKKQERILLKKQEDIKTLVRSRDLIKRIMKQKTSVGRKQRRIKDTSTENMNEEQENNRSYESQGVAELEEMIDSCLEKMIESIEITMNLEKSELELKQILSELEEVQSKSIELKLDIEKKERSGEFIDEIADMNPELQHRLTTSRIELEEIQSRIESLEAKYEFKKNKMRNLNKDQRIKTFAKLQEQLLTSEQFNSLPKQKMIAKSLIERFGASSAELLRNQERIYQLEVEISDSQQFCSMLQSQKDICVMQMTSQITILSNKLMIANQAQMLYAGKLQAAGLIDADSDCETTNNLEEHSVRISNLYPLNTQCFSSQNNDYTVVLPRRQYKTKAHHAGVSSPQPKNKYRSMRLAHQMDQSPQRIAHATGITKTDDLVKSQTKQIGDLTKLLKQAEIRQKTLLHRNEILQQKYDDIKKTSCKDKFIGILKQASDDDPFNITSQSVTGVNQQQQSAPPTSSSTSSVPSINLQQLLSNNNNNAQIFGTSLTLHQLSDKPAPLNNLNLSSLSAGFLSHRESYALPVTNTTLVIKTSAGKETNGGFSLKDRRLEVKGKPFSQAAPASNNNSNDEIKDERGLLCQYSVLGRATDPDSANVNSNVNKSKSHSLVMKKNTSSLQDARLQKKQLLSKDQQLISLTNLMPEQNVKSSFSLGFTKKTLSESMTLEDLSNSEDLSDSQLNIESPPFVAQNAITASSPAASDENDECQQYHQRSDEVILSQAVSSSARSLPEQEELVHPQQPSNALPTLSSTVTVNISQSQQNWQGSNSNMTCKYECVGRIGEAHTGPVYCVKSHENFLFSTSVKTLKIWDLESLKCVSEIQAHGSFVRGLAIIESERWIATACDKYINMWDMISMQKICTLTGHNVDIKHLHVENNLLYSAGKSGANNSGALVTWDIRKQSVIDEREKNQDIFAVLPYEKIIYYASRDHSIRRINIEPNSLPIEAFHPPHYDVATSLAVMQGGYLVSGSKDKNLKLWHTNSLCTTYKQQSYHVSDHILALETNAEKNLLYAGQKDGKIQVLTTLNGKLKDVADINNGIYSVNCLTKVDSIANQGNVFACGTADKVIKIWKPTLDSTQYLNQLRLNDHANHHQQIEEDN